MNTAKLNTALLVFSLSPKLEAERKALFGNGKKAASEKLFHQLIDGTKKLAKESGLDIFWFDEKNQIGDSFGEKYANAFQTVFDKGYQSIVSIGNDSPELNSEILSDAVDQLKHQDLIIGPSLDGGAYLIGIHKKAFELNKFKALSWTETGLFNDLIKYAQQQGLGFNTLYELLDLDSKTSLYALIQHSSLIHLVKFILLNLTEKLLNKSKANKIKPLQVFSNDFLLRGPPSLLLNSL